MAETPDIWRRRGQVRKAAQAGKAGFDARREWASASGAQSREILVRVVRTASERTGRDQTESLRAGKGGVFGEFVGCNESLDGRVFDGRLEVLADGEEIHVGDAQIVHHLHDLGPGFAEADHQAGFGED